MGHEAAQEVLGQEVLVVDIDDKVQRGLAQLFHAAGLVPTVVADHGRALELTREKFFAVALVDLDTPGQNDGLALVRALRAEAPATTVFVMSPRKAFEAAVEAFRAGATDVILKQPDQVQHLKQRVLDACSDVRGKADEARLLGEVLALHEEFLRRLMETSRRAAELEERLGGGAMSSEPEGDCRVLLVEAPEEAWLGEELSQALAARGGFALTVASSGGEGLDRASGVGAAFHIALVASALPDLPGSMVVSAFKAQSPDTITILYSRPSANGRTPGKAEVIEGSRAIALVPQFSDARQMVDRLDELKRAYTERARERRYLAAFRQQNYELLRRYAELKQKIAARKT